MAYQARRMKPSGGFELRAWYFMRISGFLLVVLALGHLFVMHILNNVESINYNFVVNRWTAPGVGYFWRIWDLLMICLAVIHGFNGLRQVLDEYIVNRRHRVFAHTLIWSATTFLIVIGTYAILMFEPDTQYLIRWRENHERPARVQHATTAPPAVRKSL
ncbi:MAG TPA: succinate dehydrogenase hydrophobic membrane anchor subunit [Isosphaeraceae bacterium]|nr:succinate dehydrogenase hydrophobic membrane anchor subunit [Isosphaeraceae bacterium]